MTVIPIEPYLPIRYSEIEEGMQVSVKIHDDEPVSGTIGQVQIIGVLFTDTDGDTLFLEASAIDDQEITVRRA